MLHTSRNLILLLVVLLVVGAQALAADVSVSVSGSEQQVSGAWDTGKITIAFGDTAGNGYSESLVYGQYSTPASIAAALAGMFSRDYIGFGLCAHAAGGVINFHLKGAINFGAPNVTGSSVSFTLGLTGWYVVPTITWAVPTTITYGTPLSAAQLTAAAVVPGTSGLPMAVPGTFTYSPAAGVIPQAGTDTLSVTFTPADTTNYASVTQTVSLVVNKVTPTITWAPPATMTYGTALSATQLDATASVPGTFAYSPAIGTVLGAGAQTLSVTFTPADTTDYNTATATVNLTVSTSTGSTGSGPWSINTVAGNGNGNYSGDGVLATSTPLGFPVSPLLDAVGNLYFAASSRVLKVSALTGDISTVAGGGTVTYGTSGPATGVSLYQPNGIAFDAAGNLYIAVTGEELVLKVSAVSGNISIVAGGGPPIAQQGDPNGDGGPATAATLTGPMAVAVDAAGNIYIADEGSNRIREVSSLTGNISTVAGSGPTAGYGSYSGDGGLATNATLYFPSGVALDNAGNIYIADTSNNRIRKVTLSTTKIISTLAGGGSGCSQQTDSLGDGCPATSAELNSPVGLAVDGAGDIFISDVNNQRIREVVASTGNIITVAGDGTGSFSGDGGPALNAELFYPEGVTVSTAGNLYIADSGNGRIREVSAVEGTSTITWPAPLPIIYGTALSAAQLNASSNVAGTFTYTPAVGTVLPAGSHTLTATFTPTDTNDYATAVATVTLTVGQATPVIAWATPASIRAGTPLSAIQLNASSNVAGTYVYSPALGTVLAAGPHTLSLTLTPTDTLDYASTTATTYITITQASGAWDSGTVSLTVNNSIVATTNYGQGATASSIAAGLAANVSANSPVNVTAVDDAVYLQAKATGSASDYPYSLQTTSYNSTIFSQPSFLNPPISGNLDGGANQNSAGTTVYSFTVPSGGYDGVGNLTNYTDSVMGTWSLSYDTLNRVAGANDNQAGNPNHYYCWGYDPFGNRTIQAGSSGAFTIGSPTCATASGATVTTAWANYSTSNNNRLANTSQGTGGIAYDAAGNVVDDGVNQYLYDGDGRICAVATSVSGATSMTGYIYNADGQRVAKGSISSWSCDPAVSGFTTTNDYILGLSGEQVTEMGIAGNNSMAWQHTNVYEGGKLIATYDIDGLHFYLNDPLGTRRAQTDYAGVLEQTCASLPFGDGLACTNSLQYPTEHHFTGKERDAESGNDYFNARYYGSSMGRFLSPDPFGGHLEYPQSLNKYAYVMNNPLRYTDPTGMDLQEVCTGKGSTTCGKSHWWNRERHVGTTDAKGHFHVTHFQTDTNGNLAGHNVNFNTSGIHIDGNKGEFIAGTDPTRVNGETGTPWADTHFVANSNCGGTCEAGGALFGSAQMLQNLATQQLIGPNKGLDALGQHPGDQYRGGNIEGPDMHLSLLPGSNVDPMHFDNRYPYGGVSGYMDHAAGWLDPAGHVETPLPQDITPVPQP